jgi:hypothetical protein
VRVWRGCRSGVRNGEYERMCISLTHSLSLSHSLTLSLTHTRCSLRGSLAMLLQYGTLASSSFVAVWLLAAARLGHMYKVRQLLWLGCVCGLLQYLRPHTRTRTRTRTHIHTLVLFLSRPLSFTHGPAGVRAAQSLCRVSKTSGLNDESLARALDRRSFAVNENSRCSCACDACMCRTTIGDVAE